MPPQVLIGWILLFLAAVIGATTMARFASGRRLTLRRRQAGPAWAAKEIRGLRADEVAPFDELLAAHLAAEESGIAASQ